MRLRRSCETGAGAGVGCARLKRAQRLQDPDREVVDGAGQTDNRLVKVARPDGADQRLVITAQLRVAELPQLHACDRHAQLVADVVEGAMEAVVRIELHDRAVNCELPLQHPADLDFA